MREIKLTKEQVRKALALGEGKVIYSYLDGSAIRMETERGVDPYVWRHDSWQKMKER